LAERLIISDLLTYLRWCQAQYSTSSWVDFCHRALYRKWKFCL